MNNYNEIARKEMLTTYLTGLLKVLTRVKFNYLIITDVETNTEVYTINRINDEIKSSDLITLKYETSIGITLNITCLKSEEKKLIRNIPSSQGTIEDPHNLRYSTLQKIFNKLQELSLEEWKEIKSKGVNNYE